MARWLSEAWMKESLRLASSQPERKGVSARIQFVVSGGPAGEVAYFWVVEDGRLVECSLGRLDDAQVVLTYDHDDAMRIQKGDLDVTSAFMQGKVRAEGDVARLLGLLPITASEEFQAFQSALGAATEY